MVGHAPPTSRTGTEEVDGPGADALPRLKYLATRALLVKYEHPGTHPAGHPGDDLDDTHPPGCPTPPPTRGRTGNGGCGPSARAAPTGPESSGS
jgi:hypothetical protein